MDSPYVGSIILFAGMYVPSKWASCNGQLLSVQHYQALYSLLGTNYGGDGVTTFALPDLRGAVPVGIGPGPGLSPVVLGEMGGAAELQLLPSNLPAHTHPTGPLELTLTVAPPCSSAEATEIGPTGQFPAVVPTPPGTADVRLYTPTADALMAPSQVQTQGAMFELTPAGGRVPVPTQMPFTALRYIISLEGIYPSAG